MTTTYYSLYSSRQGTLTREHLRGFAPDLPALRRELMAMSDDEHGTIIRVSLCRDGSRQVSWARFGECIPTANLRWMRYGADVIPPAGNPTWRFISEHA